MYRHTIDDKLIRAVAQFQRDPLGFAQFAFPWGVPGTGLEKMLGPQAWQAQHLADIGHALRNGGKGRFSTASGKGIGKSALVALICLWGLSTRTDTRIRITAGTESQLRSTLMPELAKWFRLLLCREWFKYTATQIYASDPEREKTWRLDAVTWSKENPEAFAGLHNFGKRIILIMDEASQIADPIFDTADGVMTDADTEVIWCCFGNPTRGIGRFRETFDDPRWITRNIDSRDVAITDKSELQAILDKEGGDDTDYFRVFVRGVFPRVADMQFISVQDVDTAMSNEAVTDMSDPLVMGVDVARFGGGKSVVAFRKGRDCSTIPWRHLSGAPVTELANLVAQLYELYRADAVHVDGGGVGAGVVDRLREMGVPVRDVQFGGKADNSQARLSLGRYYNKRTEMWGVLREMLPRLSIPRDATLRKDLISPLYGYKNDMAMALVPKEDMLRMHGVPSPDFGDALALTFAYPVQKRANAGGIHRRGGDPSRAETEYNIFA